VLAAVLGIAAGSVVDMLASARDGLGDLGLVLILSVVFLGWVLTPLLMPGLSDETVDPQRLEQFPITPRDQVFGLLLGSLIAPTALFTFLVAAGGTFATGEDATARVLIVLAAAVFSGALVYLTVCRMFGVRALKEIGNMLSRKSKS
jgi:magnesium-transporting ATPase (P-type)